MNFSMLALNDNDHKTKVTNDVETVKQNPGLTEKVLGQKSVTNAADGLSKNVKVVMQVLEMMKSVFPEWFAVCIARCRVKPAMALFRLSH